MSMGKLSPLKRDGKSVVPSKYSKHGLKVKVKAATNRHFRRLWNLTLDDTLPHRITSGYID